MPMIATRELDDPIATSKAASDSDGAHRRLGPGTDQSHALHARESTEDQLGDPRLIFGGRAVGGPPVRCLHDRIDDLLMSMAQDHRSPGTDVIDKAIPVQIVKISPMGFVDEQWMASDCTKGSGGGIHPTWNQMLGSFKGGLTTAKIDFHVRDSVALRGRKGKGCPFLTAGYG